MRSLEFEGITMRQLIFSALCVLQISHSVSLDIAFSIKLEFVSNFITSNHGKFDLHFSSWNDKEQQNLFKNSAQLLKISPAESTNNETSIRIYDFMLANNESLKTLTDNAVKLLLIQNDTPTDQILKDLDVLPSRNIFTARFINANENILVKLSRIYRLGNVPNSKIYDDYLLTWRSGEKVDLNLLKMKEKRINFNGMKLPVAIVLSNPRSLPRLEDFRDQWTDTYTKANYGPMMKLFAYFNITPEFKVVPDYKHLESIDNKYLLTVTAPYMTKMMLAYIDFIKVSPPTKLCYTLRRPPTSFVTTIFTVTFTAAVWYATVGLLAILSIALYFFLNVETSREDIKGKTTFNAYDLMLIGLEAICQQGTSTDPRSYASRMLQVFMFMAFMFLYVAYSANILVLLQSTTALTKHEQLVEYEMDYAGMNTSDFNYYNSETADRIFKKNVDAPVLYSVQQGMEKVQHGVFAFFLEERYGSMYARDYFTDYEVCGLQEFGARYDFSMGYAAIGKNSGYTEIFKVALNQITEQGFAYRHYLRYFLKPACYSQGSSFDNIGIREIYQAIVLVAIGVLSGLLILLLEIVLNQVRERKLLPRIIK